MRRRDVRFMRVFAFVSALSLAFGAEAGAAPLRVASLNLCTDELLLMIAAPDQIASVTHLSQSRAESPLWRQASRFRRNDGTLLSIVPLKPDFVLTMGGGARDRVRIAETLGIATLDLGFPASIADIEASIRRVARALGREPQGKRLLAQIAALKASPPPRQPDTIWLGGGGRSVGASSLASEWMALAGFRQRALAGDRVTLEQLISRPPEVLLRSDYRAGEYSGEQRWLNHPLAGKARAARVIPIDGRRWTCMGPAMIAEVERLRKVAR